MSTHLTSSDDIIERILERGRTHGIEDLNEVQRAIFIAMELDIYTIMEGLIGFYHGMDSNALSNTVRVLDEIGCETSAALILRANSLFPASFLISDKDERARMLNGLDSDTISSIDEIGDALMMYPDDLGRKITDYVYSHAKDATESL